MNVENINKLIEYVKARTWRTGDWSERQDCACGMIADILHGDRDRSYDASCGCQMIINFLDLSGREDGDAIYAMSTYTKANGFRIRGDDTYDHFAALSLEQQNAVLVDMLERFRDTGEVVWNIP
jgi:hypothetical protein